MRTVHFNRISELFTIFIFSSLEYHDSDSLRKRRKSFIKYHNITNFVKKIKMQKIIPIGADHAGFHLKAAIIAHFEKLGYQFKDYGTHSEDSIDYPDYAHPVANHIEANGGLGIVICGSGNGINMTVNKHQGIRSALCWRKDIAELARQHNDANIIALPARFVEEDLAIEMVTLFLNTKFEGGRHQNRVNKIACS